MRTSRSGIEESPAPTAGSHAGGETALASPRGCSSQRVRRLSRRLSQHFDRVVAASGLKTTQYSLLSHVVELGPLRPGELAAAMGLDASTLTRNLQPLVAAGWLAIGPGTDERSRLVTATDAGRAKRVEARRAWKRAQLALNEQLGEDLVARLHAVVDECLQVLDAKEAGAAPA